ECRRWSLVVDHWLDLQTSRESTRSAANRLSRRLDGRGRPSLHCLRWRLATEDWRLLSRALRRPYRPQSNDPVRRGVLRFRSCVPPSPPWRRYTFHRAGWLENRSLLLKEPVHGQPCHHAPARGCFLQNPLDAQVVERLLIFRGK